MNQDKSYLSRQIGHQGVGDSLRNDGEADRDSGDQVRDPVLEVVFRQPVQDWEMFVKKFIRIRFRNFFQLISQVLTERREMGDCKRNLSFLLLS